MIIIINGKSYNKRMQRASTKGIKTKHDRVVILWELCKRLQLDHSNNRYIHKPESVQRKETQKNLWDFETHLILSRKLDLVLINKKKKLVM